jgi:cystathionine gamma-synthase
MVGCSTEHAMRFDTLAAHAGVDIDETTRAVVPPIHLSTTFERAPDGSYPSGLSYIRNANPNRLALERCLARLEGGAASAAFASGSAATMAVFQALSPGDRVVAPLEAYYGTPVMLREVFVPWGLRVTFVDMTDLDAVKKAVVSGTRLVWMETPSNPRVTVSDITAVAALARSAGARLVVDNTWATPMLQRPLEIGADLVMHSTTKYLGGHGDVMGGAVVAREKNNFFTRIRSLQIQGGAVPSPLDSWLILRGIRTLPARLRVQCRNADAVARFLARHPSVERVHYPGLPSDPGHAVAARQMSLFGAMVSVVLPGGRARAFEVAARLRVFTRATSLGGPESLVEHRASIEGFGTTAPEGLLRLSIGLEHEDDLIEDLDAALR